MLSTQKHSGVNAWGYNPKSYRKFRRNLDELHANPVPKGEDYWKSFWAEESAKDDWTAAPAPKSKEQLLKEEIEKNLEDWPWKGVPQKLLTVSPYAFNYYNEEPPYNTVEVPFKLTEVIQTSKLFTELFRARPVLEIIARYLFQYHSMSWQFFATCQEAGRTMAQVLGFWDVNGNFFGHCEEPPTVKGPHHDARVSLITIVAPVRRPEGTASYVEQIENIHSLCLSVYNFAENIRNIQFHRVPFLSTRLLALLIPKMRKLENLGIYKCQLIHVGEAMWLLEIIRTDRMLGKEDQVSLDFFPNYHVGPKESLGEYCVGTYGASWDNWNGDSDIAIWAMVTRIIPQARKQGIDFESPHTAFRQWLDKSPCWRVDEMLEAISLFTTDPEYDPAKFAALVDCRNPDHYGNVTQYTGKIAHRPQGWKWSTQRIPCDYCHTSPLGIFFHYINVRPIVNAAGDVRPNRTLRCLGCKFHIVLNKEKDHFKQRKRNTIREWLRGDDGEWNDADLLKAIMDIEDKGIALRASKMDDNRQELRTKGWDPEEAAIQTPITEREKNQKFSSWHRSPLVGDKNNDPKFMTEEEKMWRLIARPERRHEHGY